MKAIVGFFREETQPQKDNVNHIIIPRRPPQYRNGLYIKYYPPIEGAEKSNPIIFFHGGPDIVNQEQYSEMLRVFCGCPFYIPEVEGSSMYSQKQLPIGFQESMIPSELKLFDLSKSGLNEFTQNYADDIKTVIEEISKRHCEKINVITHSFGSHQVLRTLQLHPDLTGKIGAICSIAGTYDMGANRFWCTLNNEILRKEGNAVLFSTILGGENKRFLKSSANVGQPGPEIDGKNNPSVDRTMNRRISVRHGDVSNFPPILLVHAKDDQAVFFQLSFLFERAIRQAGGMVKSLYFNTGGHLFIKNDGEKATRDAAVQTMQKFFKDPTIDIDNSDVVGEPEDIIYEHEKFLENTEKYLSERFSK